MTPSRLIARGLVVCLLGTGCGSGAARNGDMVRSRAGGQEQKVVDRLPDALRTRLELVLRAHATCIFDNEVRELVPSGPDGKGSWEDLSATSCAGPLRVCEVNYSEGRTAVFQLGRVKNSCDDLSERLIVVAELSKTGWVFSWPARFGAGFQDFDPGEEDSDPPYRTSTQLSFAPARGMRGAPAFASRSESSGSTMLDDSAFVRFDPVKHVCRISAHRRARAGRRR